MPRSLRRTVGGVSDNRTFEELLSTVLDPAFRLAMTMLNDRTAAEDAVQEAAVKAWRSFGRFRAGAEMRPWFLTIVANECRSAGPSGCGLRGGFPKSRPPS